MPKNSQTTRRSLSEFIELQRRYTRSVNLERDLADSENLRGYIVTERAGQALRQISEAISRKEGVSAWTLTGVYGTGKSSFAHFLASLLASKNDEVKLVADSIFENCSIEPEIKQKIQSVITNKGFVRAVVTAGREPLEKTILRSLRTGTNSFWKKNSDEGKRFNAEIDRLENEIDTTGKANPRGILSLIQELTVVAKVGLILIIDEFGKCLEYAAINRHTEDLYLLQQIKELSVKSESPIFLFGLLHQAFSEYGYGLGMVERNEWIKIQGRFEEIPFTESARQMVYLTGQAIKHSFNNTQEKSLRAFSQKWHQELQIVFDTQTVNAEVLCRAMPLHPLSALALPQLCLKYAQNDRSLFTFLTGAEPGSLRTFLEENKWSDNLPPLLKLDRLYDYFVDTAQAGLTSKPGFQRWTEVKSLVDEHLEGDAEILRILKSIGVLNLAATTGFLRAGRKIVSLALCDEPDNKTEIERIDSIIEKLIQRGILTYRERGDELRLWEGSDFDVEIALRETLSRQQFSLRQLLSGIYPLRPIVAQRHSYRIGATRVFECHYFENIDDFENLTALAEGCDGIVGYWVSETDPPMERVPKTIDDIKPFVLIKVGYLDILRLRSLELAALKEMAKTSSELQNDGVARREVRFRLLQARNQFDEAFTRSLKTGESTIVWIKGKVEQINLRKELNGRLSDLLDEVYQFTPVIWNELINRQVLTSQGAKANRQVLSAMLENADVDNLGFDGFGPEVSVYNSVLERTGIHRKEDYLSFYPPQDQSLKPVWNEISEFCLAAKEKPVCLDVLFKKLQQPPFGVKSGLIPILLAAVLINRSDDTSLYNDGVFVPVLGAEHFELLVKNPARFAVKNYFVTGIQAKIFKELENILSEAAIVFPQQIRNKNLLGIVTPLLKFARRLPKYTKQTKNMSPTACKVRDALLNANEPDKLLLESLPKACGFGKISSKTERDDLPRKLRTAIILALKELNEARGLLLVKCRSYLHDTFGVRQDISYLREDLRSRSSYFVGRSIEPVLTRFISDATNIAANDDEWLENIVMGIADKPLNSWTDADIDAFGLKLNDLSRRFKYLEAIIKDNSTLWNNRAEARRVSIVRTDGSELHDIAWIDEAEKPFLENKAEEIIAGLSVDRLQQKALLAVLTEKILGSENHTLLKVTQLSNVHKEDADETYSRIIGRKG